MVENIKGKTVKIVERGNENESFTYRITFSNEDLSVKLELPGKFSELPTLHSLIPRDLYKRNKETWKSDERISNEALIKVRDMLPKNQKEREEKTFVLREDLLESGKVRYALNNKVFYECKMDKDEIRKELDDLRDQYLRR